MSRDVLARGKPDDRQVLGVGAILGKKTLLRGHQMTEGAPDLSKAPCFRLRVRAVDLCRWTPASLPGVAWAWSRVGNRRLGPATERQVIARRGHHDQGREQA